MNAGCSWNYSLTSEHQAPTQQGRASGTYQGLDCHWKNTHSSQKHHHWYIYMFTNLFWEQYGNSSANQILKASNQGSLKDNLFKNS